MVVYRKDIRFPAKIVQTSVWTCTFVFLERIIMGYGYIYVSYT